tara:strand:+ start:402 stop:1793 length:1392 start_codon:yes stop_codon:yes gene_type:complete
MAEIQYAGEYELQELKLYSSTGNVIDLTTTTIEINLFEDMNRTSMSGSVIIADTNNLILNTPILGQEYVSLKIKTPSLDGEEINFTDHVFCAYKIGIRSDLSQSSELFEIHLTTPELQKNIRTRISKSYTGTIDEIVTDVIRNELFVNSKKPLFIEPTSGIKKIISPNINPYNFIQMLRRQAISAHNQSPHFVFFENSKGIHFRSLQSLYEQESMSEYHAGDMGDHTDTQGKTGDIEQDFKRVLSFTQSSNNDMLVNIKTGLLGSKITVFDIYNKNYNTTTHDYFKNFKDFGRLGSDPIYNEAPIDVKNNNIGNFPDAKVHLYPTSTTTDYRDAQHYDTETSSYPYTSNKIQDTLLSRQAKRMELETTINLALQINGNTTIAAGQVINFSKPTRGNAHGQGEKDEVYSGNYLITKLRHMFTQGTKKHEISMIIAKDSIDTSYRDFADGTEPTGKMGVTHKSLY